MCKKITFLLLFFLMLWNIAVTQGQSWDINLKNMSPQELLEFYKKNPDYWKKRLEIDYNSYIKWDYVVLRGEYIDQTTNKPIPNILVNFTFDWKEYFYTTSEKWVFNLELDKNLIKPERNYRIKMKIDRYYSYFNAKWDKLLKDSIYHFKINKVMLDWWYHMHLTTIHNLSFPGWKNWFTFEEKTIVEPSIIWIQWFPLLLFFGLIVFFLSFFAFKGNWIKSKNRFLNIYKKKK